MPRLRVSEGVEIHYEEQGSGPLVVFVSYWSLHPSVFDPVIADLSRDHRVVRYDDRGAGLSSQAGPYDLDTAARDLEALIESLGGPAILLCTADAANRAVRVAAGRAELVEAVVSVGTVPLGREEFARLDVLSSSDGVVEALLAQVENDYRGTLRSVLAATNPQMDEERLRERVHAQVKHCPQGPASARLRAWVEDAPAAHGRETGDRLWVLVAESQTGGWFPAGRQMARVVERELPQAHVMEVADGMVSRPDESSRVVREISARARVAASE